MPLVRVSNGGTPDFVQNPTFTNKGATSPVTVSGLDNNALYFVNGASVTITKGTVLCTIPGRNVYSYGGTTQYTYTQYIVQPVDGQISYTKSDVAGMGGYCKIASL